MDRIQTYSPDQVSQAIETNTSLLLIHFGSPLASSCEVVREGLEALAPDFQGRIAFGEVGELPLQDMEWIQRYSIESIPTLILFRGGTEDGRAVGAISADQLATLVDTGSIDET